MKIRVFASKATLAESAANEAAENIRDAIRKRGQARIIVATGASQFDFLECLIRADDINWTQVEMFHLDEYVGISSENPASFCRYLRDRLLSKVPIEKYHLLDGLLPAAEVMEQVSAEIRKAPIDIAFTGLGENGHLAFNDPPADFDTEEAYHLVTLDDACRQQQWREGWFARLENVPRQAISMTIPEIMKARQIICIAMDARKAIAVKVCFDGEVSPAAPASILQRHERATVYLDRESAALLSAERLRLYGEGTQH